MAISNNKPTHTRIISFLSKNDWILTALILLVALLMIIPNISGGIWEDEFITYKEAVLGDPVALTGKPATLLDVQPMLARLGHHLVGEAWGIRLPSILFGLGTIFFVGLLANDLFGKEVKFLAMIIATFSPLLIEFSGEGRPYTALAFWGIAFLYMLNRQMMKETISTSASLVVISVFGLLTRLTFLGQLAIGAVFYLLKKRKLSKYSIAIIIIVIPFVIRSLMEVFAYDTISTKLNDTGQPVELINFTIRTLFSFTFGYNTFQIPDLSMSRNIPIQQLVSDNLLTFSSIALITLGFFVGFFMLIKKQPKNTALLLTYILVPSAFTFLVAQTGYTVIREKFLIAALGAYLILIAAMFRELFRFKSGYLVGAAYVLVIGLGFYNFYFHADTHSRRMMIPELNSKVLKNISENDILVSYTSLYQEPDYYTVANKHSLSVIVYDKATDNHGFTRISEQILNDSTGNKIFLIDDTTKRHLKDTNAIIINSFKSKREWKRTKFGRNLSLYVFE